MGCGASTTIVSKQLYVSSALDFSTSVHGKSCSLLSDDYFTASQKQCLRETWSLLGPDKQSYGADIFKRIFTLEPKIKNLFPFKDLHGENLLNDSLFTSHAKRFMQAIESIIVNLDVLEVIVIPVLGRLGAKHACFVGFKEEYMAVFTQATVDVFTRMANKSNRNQAQEAWTQVGYVLARQFSGDL